ncbi:hypothetical protein OAE31_02905 [Gammaproteobacteria bacterium]|nr:hypothetical protein [Gammaproteobacteria bacterium]
MNYLRRLKLRNVLNFISFIYIGFWSLNFFWGVLLLTSLFPVDNSNIFIHILVFTLKVNIVSLIIELLIAISFSVNALKTEDRNKELYMDDEIPAKLGGIFDWVGEVIFRIAGSIVIFVGTYMAFFY